MEFKISKELIQQLEQLIDSKSDKELEALLNDMHHADIAEILDELNFDDATYIFKVLDSYFSYCRWWFSWVSVNHVYNKVIYLIFGFEIFPISCLQNFKMNFKRFHIVFFTIRLILALQINEYLGVVWKNIELIYL